MSMGNLGILGSNATPALLEERLHQIVVFELREDGSTEYSTMTLRALYNHVVSTITDSCKRENQERQMKARQMQLQQQQSRRFPATEGNTTFGVSSSEDATKGSTRNRSSTSTDIAIDPIIPDRGDSFLRPPPTSFTPSTTSYPPPTTPTHASSFNLPPHLPSLSATPNVLTTLGEHEQMSTMPDSTTTTTPATPNETFNLPSISTRQDTGNARGAQPRHLRSQTVTHFNNTTPTNTNQNHGNSPRERLGGYLHPRDMRRLVTPFSSSNEPSLMVRRHVMLLNFDPLRAIVLRDRLLVLVPDGADSILIELEKRVRGGIVEMENQVFGSVADGNGGMEKRSESHDEFAAPSPSTSQGEEKSEIVEEQVESDDQPSSLTLDKSSHGISVVLDTVKKKAKDMVHHKSTNESSNDDDKDNVFHDSISAYTLETQIDNEWDDMQKQMDWSHMPFELQSVDAVLQTVTQMLINDARDTHHRSVCAMSELRGDHRRGGPGSGSGPGEHAQERLRLHKDEVNLMEGRVQGFVRAMNEVLDDDEDMTLMNLSRLLSHPERFIQPVSQEILHEESDEPELILEAYLQQALSIVNELDLLKGQIMTTEEQISMTLDAIRNRLLYINTLLSVASLCVASGSFVGSLFGMNLINPLDESGTAFFSVTIGTCVAMALLWVTLSWVFFQAANISPAK